MKVNNRNKNKNKMIVGVIIVLSLISAGIAFAYSSHIFNFSSPEPNGSTSNQSIDYGAPTNDQVKSGTDTKSISTNSSSSTPPDNPSGKLTISVSVTVSQQTESAYQIRSLIATVTNTGTCTLKLTKDGNIITKTADVQAQSSSSTCKGFDIDLSSLTKGIWSYSLSFENSSNTGSTKGTITVN